jgi:hypothetical protein
MTANQQDLTTIVNTPAAVEWFRGLFDRIHIAMTDTGERFTIVHRGDRMEIEEGIGGEAPNFIVPLESQNIRNLLGFFTDNRIDAYEEYRIVKFMLVPCLRAVLAMPILQNRAFRKIVRVETHWQEALLDPNGNEDEQLTVIGINDQWLVIPGYHGTPQRRMVMTPAQILDFQRRLLQADNSGGIAAWLDFGRWYTKWRRTVSVVGAEISEEL